MIAAVLVESLLKLLGCSTEETGEIMVFLCSFQRSNWVYLLCSPRRPHPSITRSEPRLQGTLLPFLHLFYTGGWRATKESLALATASCRCVRVAPCGQGHRAPAVKEDDLKVLLLRVVCVFSLPGRSHRPWASTYVTRTEIEQAP